MSGLSVSRLVRVTISLTPQGARELSFGILMVAGDSDVINGQERYRSYSTYEAVVEEFGTNAPEAKAAQLYFGQSPQPAEMMIGRWLRTATAGQNDGGILTAAQQSLPLWQSITAGSVQIAIDGTNRSLTGLNFSAQTNLNGVATVIQTALVSAGATGATVAWNGQNFVVKSGTTGAGVRATGTLTFGSNPANNDTVTLNGLTITFKTSGATGNQVNLGSTGTETAANLMQFLLASTDPLLTVASYSRVGTVITITYGTVGTGGNAYTLAISATNPVISGGTLTGGAAPSTVGYATAGASGTDISTMLKLTSSTAQALIPGYDAETPAACAAALAAASPLWYGLMFSASTQPTDDQNMDVAAVIEALSIKRVFGVTITDTSVLSAQVTTDLASRLKDANYRRTCTQYSSFADYVIASFFGRNFSVNYSGTNTTITVMYKQEPGVPAELLTEAQANALESKNCNVFVQYVNDTSIVQYGTMADGTFFDIVHDTDWFENACQTAVYNVLYTTPTKVPQTDAGMNQITNAIAGVCQRAVDNGMVAPGTWNGPSFGSIVQGQFLKTGYYIYAQPIALQSQAARAARQAPPIQVALKLAGAIQTVDILVSVNQ